jgi:hypothetical protein
MILFQKFLSKSLPYVAEAGSPVFPNPKLPGGLAMIGTEHEQRIWKKAFLKKQILKAANSNTKKSL